VFSPACAPLLTLGDSAIQHSHGVAQNCAALQAKNLQTVENDREKFSVALRSVSAGEPALFCRPRQCDRNARAHGRVQRVVSITVLFRIRVAAHIIKQFFRLALAEHRP
jgi:hypothetical protein